MFGAKEDTSLKAKKVVEGAVVDAEEEDMRYDIQEWGGTSLSNLEAEIEEGKAIGGLVSDLFFKPISGGILGGILG